MFTKNGSPRICKPAMAMQMQGAAAFRHGNVRKPEK